MPELPVKEVRMPELHLPEIDRAEITRSLSEMHMPEFDLPKIDRPKMPDRMANVDLGKAVAGIVAMTPFRPRRSRPRWPSASAPGFARHFRTRSTPSSVAVSADARRGRNPR